MSFLQLTPENIKQARSLSYPEAFKLDQTYKFDPNFKGGVSRSKYIGEGLKSLFGFGDPKIGGATPLTRKLALDAADLFKSGVGFAAKRAAPFISLFGSTELGADDQITQEMRDSISLNPGRGDFIRAPNEAFQQILDDEYEEGEMMDNVADAPEAGITRKLLDAIKGAGSAISNLGIVGLLKNVDQFKNLSPLDQKFILQQAGGNRPAKDRFGYNIRSAFGNYADLVGDRVDIARDRIARGIPLRAIDQYYLDKEKERRALEEKAQREFLANQARTQSRGGDGPQNNPQGGLGRQDYSRAASADFASLADELGIDYR